MADRNGQYEGTFTRHYCHEEMYTARMNNCHIIGVMETDARHGAPDWRLERTRALTGGPQGRPVHSYAEDNLKLLETVNFIPKRVQAHETGAYLDEVIKQGLEDWRGKRASFDWAATCESTEIVQTGPQLAVDRHNTASGGYQSLSVERTRSIFERSGNAVQQAPSLLTEILPDFVMPPSKTHHFCICNQQAESALGNRATLLGNQLTERFGCQVVYPGDMDDLEATVKKSVCLLIFLGGEGGCVFANPICRQLVEFAAFDELPFVGVGESEASYTAMNLSLEQNSAPQQYAKLLAEITFLPMRSLEHELSALLTEIVKQGLGRLTLPRSRP